MSTKEFIHPFRGMLARLDNPSRNGITLSGLGEYKLPEHRQMVPVSHRPNGDDIFTSVVGLVDTLEVGLGFLWATGYAMAGIAQAINERKSMLSLEMHQMEYDKTGNQMYIYSGTVRAALLVAPEKFGWTI